MVPTLLLVEDTYWAHASAMLDYIQLSLGISKMEMIKDAFPLAVAWCFTYEGKRRLLKQHIRKYCNNEIDVV